MKESEARALTEHVLTALVRYRGMAAEQLPPDIRGVGNLLQKWSLGDQNAIVACEKMLAQSPMAPSAFYNLMVVSHQLAPEIALAVSILREVNLPDPDPRWVMGWEPEEEKP